MVTSIHQRFYHILGFYHILKNTKYGNYLWINMFTHAFSHGGKVNSATKHKACSKFETSLCAVCIVIFTASLALEISSNILMVSLVFQYYTVHIYIYKTSICIFHLFFTWISHVSPSIWLRVVSFRWRIVWKQANSVKSK